MSELVNNSKIPLRDRIFTRKFDSNAFKWQALKNKTSRFLSMKDRWKSYKTQILIRQLETLLASL